MDPVKPALQLRPIAHNADDASRRPWAPRFLLGRGWIFILGFLLTSAHAASPAPKHWAFEPIQRPALPTSANRLSAAHLIDLLADTPRNTERATRFDEVRRLSFTLRGLPPTPDEVEQYLKDDSADAFRTMVERYLASPHYGERWGKHWLESVGYADSNGYFNADTDRPYAYKYRDYVIRSMNADKPLDQFIREQLAGDELVGYEPGGDVLPYMVDPLIATHYWRNAPDGSGESDGNPLEVKVDQYAVLEGNVQIFGSAFLGLTLQCARCHDHKFEPFTQQEYYQLQAIFRPAFDPSNWLKPAERVLTVGTRAERESNRLALENFQRDTKTLREAIEGLLAPFRKQLQTERIAALPAPLNSDLKAAWEASAKDQNAAQKELLRTNATVLNVSETDLTRRFPELSPGLVSLQAALRSRESNRPEPLEKIAVLTNPKRPEPVHHLLLRGNHAHEGAAVVPGVPAAFSRKSSEFSPRKVPNQAPANRLALAQWLTSSEHPLLARVLVNRIWQQHFGEGLVVTSENLGKSGARPSHPALLDFLAAELIQSGWSLKHLHRQILLSDTWRQSTIPPRVSANPTAANSPALRRLARLDAETIRDSMLAVSGELDSRLGGPYVPISTDSEGQIVVSETHPGARRRSVYLQQRRTQPLAMLEVFDSPQLNPACSRRTPSTVTLQSLSLLNSDFLRQRSRAFARRLLSQCPEDESAAISLAYQLAYSRPPKAAEHSASQSFLQTQANYYAAAKSTDARQAAWTDFCQALLASNEFLYVR